MPLFSCVMQNQQTACLPAFVLHLFYRINPPSDGNSLLKLRALSHSSWSHCLRLYSKAFQWMQLPLYHEQCRIAQSRLAPFINTLSLRHYLEYGGFVMSCYKNYPFIFLFTCYRTESNCDSCQHYGHYNSYYLFTLEPHQVVGNYCMSMS